MDSTLPLISGVEHVALIATDPDALADWYQRALGATVAWASEKPPRTYLLRLGNDLLEVGPAPVGSSPAPQPRDAPGLRHLALAVDDFDAAVATLRERGVRFTTGELAGALPSRLIFFTDPEGNHLHLIWRPQTV
jgi:catechol 2,3-dioxygenase-like lactoylglutathione lyase family enzyme